MTTSTRRGIRFLLLALLLGTVVGLLGMWLFWDSLTFLVLGGRSQQFTYDTPTQLARVRVPHQSYSLVWSPDGAYLAGVAGSKGMGMKSEVYVVDVAAETFTTLTVDALLERVAFSPDGKWLGVEVWAGKDKTVVRWWDPVKGKRVEPDPAGVAFPPAGRESADPHRSPDGKMEAHGESRYPRGMNEAFGPPSNKWGDFVLVTKTGTRKTWTWRVGESSGGVGTPEVAFSPDGTRLAGAVKQTEEAAIFVWAVPK